MTTQIKDFATKYKYPLVVGLAALSIGGAVLAGTISSDDVNNVSYSQTTKQFKTSTSSSSSDTNVAKAETAVKKAEDDQTVDNVNNAQLLVDKITDKSAKEKLQKRLDLVRNAISVKAQVTSAENAIKTSEDNQTRENVAAAQAEVDKVTDADTKAKLQARLDAVSNALTAKEAEANRVAAEQAAAQEAQAQATQSQASQSYDGGGTSYSSSGQTVSGGNATGGYYPQTNDGSTPIAQIPSASDAAAYAQWQRDEVERNNQRNNAAANANYSWAATAP